MADERSWWVVTTEPRSSTTGPFESEEAAQWWAGANPGTHHITESPWALWEKLRPACTCPRVRLASATDPAIVTPEFWLDPSCRAHGPLPVTPCE